MNLVVFVADHPGGVTPPEYTSRLPEGFVATPTPFGFVATKRSAGRSSLLRSPSGDLVVVTGAVSHATDRVADLLPDVLGRLGSSSAAAAARLQELEGAFAAFLWHAAASELTILTDFLGVQPIFECAVPGGTLWATALSVANGLRDAPPEFDAAGWAHFFMMGHLLDERTQLRGATRLPAALHRRIAWPSGERTDRRYWQWPQGDGRATTEEAADGIVAAVRRNLDGILREDASPTVLLSGGFDSRLILALLAERGARPRLVTHRHPDENADADFRFARSVARTFGLDVEPVESSPDFFGTEAYLGYLQRNAFVVPSLYLFIAQVSAVVVKDSSAILDGCLLGPTLKFSHGAADSRSYFRHRTESRVAAFDRHLRPSLDPAFAEAMQSEHAAAVERIIDTMEPGAHGAWRIQVQTRMRMRTGPNPFQVYASDVPTYAPGMSIDAWDAACRARVSDRLDKSLVHQIYARHFPKALEVPFVSGVKMSALGDSAEARAMLRVQRLRSRIQRQARRPRIARALQSLGIRPPFRFNRSHYVEEALRSHALPASVLRPDLLSGGGAALPSVARNAVFYLEGWRRLMHDEWRWDGTARGAR